MLGYAGKHCHYIELSEYKLYMATSRRKTDTLGYCLGTVLV